jgi:hypothetical protein
VVRCLSSNLLFAYNANCRCGQQCRLAGYALAGVEASHQCACANKLSSPTMVAPTPDCNETCTGTKTETCGGNLRVWIFNASSVGPPPPVPPTPPPTPAPTYGPWPVPNATARPIFHVGGLDNSKGYVGDANGMMYRTYPGSPTDRNGLFHLSWQCFDPDCPCTGATRSHAISSSGSHSHRLSSAATLEQQPPAAAG